MDRNYFTRYLFRTVYRSNLNILVRVVCKSLETAIKQNLTNNIDDKDKLSMWVTVTLALESLVTALRIQDLRPNLISFVKVIINFKI